MITPADVEAFEPSTSDLLEAGFSRAQWDAMGKREPAAQRVERIVMLLKRSDARDLVQLVSFAVVLGKRIAHQRISDLLLERMGAD